ncbi:alpha/beta hydrolase [Kibdelosporangium aridum]|uniref:Pimeloyl-ACP methyl ester carboxylesterase n=1 Tax=Kibdelosporangium aridum TaxID=2030 RepID=A0A1W2D5N2_KIBAR|nr:alpha/beta hydrolase [Kibdelosporangium aridum]SMC92382.1 Pimeloyl-ACP methyl ester carboxylesterase [Kibdelosporangium aridum]
MRILMALIAGALVAPLVSVTAHASVRWRPCERLPLECTTVSVPLDYAKPSGPKIDIAVSRKKATKVKRGVLLLNPGGPGDAGLEEPKFVSDHSALAESYDLIGFDPRGTGRSAPVTCGLTDSQREPWKVFPYPAPDGDITDNIAYARQIAKQCFEHDGRVLPHITTANTARDMDRIRIALGERKISYLGYSYGTYLGAVYTTLFPHQGDRFLLDSAIDPGGIWRTAFQSWGRGIEESFDHFAQWAGGDVREAYSELAAKLGNPFRSQVRTMLYAERHYPALLDLLKTGKLEPARLKSATSSAVWWAIACNEGKWPRDPAQYQRDVYESRKQYPIANGLSANIWPCAFWPVPPVEPVGIRKAQAKVLVLQNTKDPATPLSGAVAMSSALGAKLVTADQAGHGVYLYTNHPATAAATDFLLEGTEGFAQRPDSGQVGQQSQRATQE